MKHIFTILCLLLMITACKEKQETTEPQQNPTIPEEQTSAAIPTTFDTNIYSYKKNTLSSTCKSDDEIVCAIETVVKCALKNTEPYCDKKTMPDFIFYDDAMFADDNGLGRPTQQSFKIVKIKRIDDTMIEVFTEGQCDKNWFGNCAGNIIYVMTNKTGKWKVKEIYALEHI